MSVSRKALSSEARRYVNRHLHILFQRAVYVCLFATVQIAVLVWIFLRMHALVPYFLVGCVLLSVLAAMHIINRNNNPAYKMAWLIPILLLPIFGGLLYLMFGSHHKNRRLCTLGEDLRRRYRTPETAAMTCGDTVAALAPRDCALMSHYIEHAGGCPPFCRFRPSRSSLPAS